MTPRNRVLSFGGSLLVILLGLLARGLFGGVSGEAVSIALISLGGIAVVSLVFLEVGLGEDRERERERASRSGAAPPRPPRRPGRWPRRPQ